MKNQWKGFIFGILASVLVFSMSITAFAAYQKTATLNYSGITITLDGTTITPKDVNGNTVEPFTMDNTTYLPVRAIANALGMGVDWNAETQTVILTSGGSASNSTAAPAATTSYSRTNPAPVGTIQSLSITSAYSTNYSFSAVILESYRGDEALQMVKATNQFNSDPEDGMEYIVVKIRVSLDSIENDESKWFSESSFTPFSSTNAQYKSVAVVDPDPTFSGSLYAGGTLEGYATYAVEKTDTAPKLVIGENYDGTGGIWFLIS